MGRQFDTDCEGPISKNDNALELTGHFLPEGNSFFAKISKYDDYLADVAKKPGYKAGDTLRLILPFLKAYGATNKGIEGYSAKNILLMPGARDTLDHIARQMPAFIISTSYQPYICSLCKVIGFPEERVYCTELDIDKYDLPKPEIKRLREFREEIVTLPMIGLPADATSFDELPSESKQVIERLDKIFWGDIPGMECGRMLSEVNPIGGVEKANALKNSLERTGNRIEDVMYVGDSITDVQAFALVREGGGLAVSFNGNRYALRSAEVACISADTVAISILADVFLKGGRKTVLDLARNWSRSALEEFGVEKTLLDKMSAMDILPKVELVSNTNRQRLTQESEAFRKSVRGKEVGRLG